MPTRDRLSQVNCIIFKRESDGYKFLVLKRREDRGGFWQSVTGGVKIGERKPDALVRELKEETGIEHCLELIDLNYSFSFRVPKFGVLVEDVYAVEVLPETKISISDEHTEYKWLGIKEAIAILKYKTNKEGFKRLWKILEKRG